MAVQPRPATSGMSKRQRARIGRGVQYAVLLAVVIVAALLADWGRLQDELFNLEIARALFPTVLSTALLNTVLYTALGFALGLGLALVLALMRMSSVAPYRWISGAYIEFFRGLPALLVFLSIGIGIPTAFNNISFNRNVTVMIALGIVGSAYMAETIRAGIKAVPNGQLEAARSLGMSHGRATITVVIPQAFRIILPPLTNELILLTKDSSLVFVLGATLAQQELTQFGRAALTSYQSMTPILVVGLCYLVITIPLSVLQQRLERRFGPDGR
ncbi:polar amino acid transport system permease protein [Actinopolyspora lacussalsi subsp. righensis]|uniref:Polar amino acid transport system permease protein n=2 Tax=Actinopolyspora righensis TaxID=995060 RepID=A0A1I7BVY5_9ACTN|nr:amino acid ABC transporter permease [Actinopolyspora righensis]SFT91338.1 polar amino acid transport system permease protein [Actinopolyspora righensis]